MILRPIAFYESEIDSLSIVKYVAYHQTYNLIGTNILCSGDDCLLCKIDPNNISVNGIDNDKQIRELSRLNMVYKRFLMPIMYVSGRYINSKVLYKTYNEVITFLSKIRYLSDKGYNISTFIEHGKNKSNLMLFVDSDVEKIYRITSADYKISRDTIHKIVDLKNFNETYIKKYFNGGILEAKYIIKKYSVE